jgi:hypothetical protein
MSVTSSDIVVYGSANMPEADGTTSGGAIDTSVKIIFTDISATDEVEILSDAGGDTSQTVTVYGRDAGGSIVSETETLTGTTPVATAQAFERILKITCSSASHGTITIRKESDDVTIATMENGIDAVRRPFYDATAEASGGSAKVFYEKVFVQNDHATLSLLSATITASADPSGLLAFDLEDAVNDSNSTSNRLTSPAGGDMLGSPTWDDAEKAVPGTDLAAAGEIGVWLRLSLAAGQAAAKTTYTLTVAGSST